MANVKVFADGQTNTRAKNYMLRSIHVRVQKKKKKIHLDAPYNSTVEILINARHFHSRIKTQIVGVGGGYVLWGSP